MKSDIETAIQWSKRLEGLLEQKFGAVGKGLHGKIDSVQARLAQPTLKKLRFVATVRNKIVHEESYTKLEDRAGFERACADIIRDLDSAADSVNQRLRRGGSRASGRSLASKIKFYLQTDALSPVLSAIGGCGAFVASVISGKDIVTSLFFGVAGAAIGWHWYPILIVGVLAGVVYAGYKFLPELYDFTQRIGR